MRTLTRRLGMIGLVAAAGLGAAGAAWAAWRLTGSGTAQVRAGSVVDLTVTSAGLPTGGLTPGGSTAVQLKVSNANRFPVRITDIDLTDLRSDTAGCSGADNVAIVDDAPLPDRRTVPAATDATPATETIVWNGALRMAEHPANACQNANFTFTVRLYAVSAAP